MSAPIVVETRGLAKHFGTVEAVRSVDLEVPRRSIFGFLGPNGAGKTTTLRMLVGLLSPTAGSGTVLGYQIGKDDLALRRHIGYLPQQPRFYPDLTARETLRYAGRFFYRPGPGLESRIEEMIEVSGLTERADRPVGVFSGGERQRLGIAQAQLHQPELLILDEPAAGLDPLGRRDVLNLLTDLREQTTVLYSTHILDDVQRVSDMVAIINQGRMVAHAPIEQLLAGTEGAVYLLQTRGPTEAIQTRLQNLPWIERIEIEAGENGDRWMIVGEEGEADRHLLRSVLADPAIVVTDFGRQRFELEDVFVRVVEEQTS